MNSNYFVFVNGTQEGPFTMDDIRERWRNAPDVFDTLMVWREGMDSWCLLSSLPKTDTESVAAPEAKNRSAVTGSLKHWFSPWRITVGISIIIVITISVLLATSKPKSGFAKDDLEKVGFATGHLFSGFTEKSPDTLILTLLNVAAEFKGDVFIKQCSPRGKLVYVERLAVDMEKWGKLIPPVSTHIKGSIVSIRQIISIGDEGGLRHEDLVMAIVKRVMDRDPSARWDNGTPTSGAQPSISTYKKPITTEAELIESGLDAMEVEFRSKGLKFDKRNPSDREIGMELIRQSIKN